MGRKSLRDEAIQANVINLSWTTISRALASKKVSEDQKRMIALEIVKKTCPKEITLKGDQLVSDIYSLVGHIQQDFQKNRLPPLVLDSGHGVN